MPGPTVQTAMLCNFLKFLDISDFYIEDLTDVRSMEVNQAFEDLTIQDIVSKSQGSSNPHNMLKATFKAFEELSSPKLVANRRGLKIGEIVGRRDLKVGGNINTEVSEEAEG